MKILRVFYNNHIKFPSSHASRRDYLNEYPLHDMPRINMKKNLKKIIKANKKRERAHIIMKNMDGFMSTKGSFEEMKNE